MPNTYYSSHEPDRDEDTRFRCRHIFPDGHRCGSPCLRAEELCYYHHTTRRPIANAPARKARRGSFSLNLADLVDRSGIQLAIAEVLQRIASNDIDPRRAGLLLYGLQTASLNLPKPPAKPQPIVLVDDIVEHPTLGTLAPTARIADLKPRTSISRLLDELRAKKPAPEQTPQPETHTPIEPQPLELNELDELQPTILPNLQASADTQYTPNRNPLRTLHTNRGRGDHRNTQQKASSAKLKSDGFLPLRQAQRPGKFGTRNT